MSAFEEFGVMPELIKAVQELGWELPRDIQAEAIPLILGGGDVMAAAETGSGKTGVCNNTLTSNEFPIIHSQCSFFVLGLRHSGASDCARESTRD
jgi:hypothetical protein